VQKYFNPHTVKKLPEEYDHIKKRTRKTQIQNVLLQTLKRNQTFIKFERELE
jgi:hypothetical protein